MRLRALLFLYVPLAAALVAGCAQRLDADAVGPDARPSAWSLAAMTDSLASATLPRRPMSVRRALARVGATPLADGGRAARWSAPAGGPRSIAVAAFVPGRDPLARSELVVLSVDMDGQDAAAVLEAVRVLVERSLWRTAPERSVEVVLWRGSPPGGDQAALWARSNVRALLTVGDTAPTVEGVVVESLPSGGDGLALAGHIVDRITGLSRRSAPPASAATPDTLVTR